MEWIKDIVVARCADAEISSYCIVYIFSQSGYCMQYENISFYGNDGAKSLPIIKG